MSATPNSKSDSAGRHHWVVQRATAVALVPLMIWFVLTVVSLTGSSYDEVVAHFNSSWRISLMVIFVATVFYHGYLGLQVVVEDYISDTNVRMWMLVAVKFLAILFAVVGIVSTLRIGI